MAMKTESTLMRKDFLTHLNGHVSGRERSTEPESESEALEVQEVARVEGLESDQPRIVVIHAPLAPNHVQADAVPLALS